MVIAKQRCPNCDVALGESHQEGCQYLAALRAQSYPEILTDTGMSWQLSQIHELLKENEKLKEALEQYADVTNWGDFPPLHQKEQDVWQCGTCGYELARKVLGKKG